MKNLGRPNYFTIWLIIAIVLVFFSGPAQAYVYDDFTGAGINTGLWTDIGSNTGLFSQPGDGFLHFNDPPPGGHDDNLRSFAPVSGPFFVSMQYSNFQATNTATGDFAGSSAVLWVGIPGASRNIFAVFEFTKANGTVQGFQANSHVGTVLSHLATYVPSSATSGSLGIGFNGILGAGGLLTLWYDDGSGWKEIASAAPNFISDPYFAIEGYDPSGTALSFRVAEVDLTPVPLPPSVLLLSSGLFGLGALGWRRQRGFFILATKSAFPKPTPLKTS